MDAIQKIEPYAWSSFNVLTGTEYIQKLPITSLQPGVYKNFPLYDAQTLASKEAEIERLKAALERTLSWLTSYPGGGTMGENGPYEQARAALTQPTE